MASSSRIPTPLKQHWYRFRVGALPVLSFIGCVIFMLFLWQRQAYHGALVGEVEATSVDVISDIAGELTFPGDNYWQIYDSVSAGQTIARLDDRPTLARLDTVKAQIAKLEKDLEAARTNLLNDHLALEQRQAQDKLQLLLEVESRLLQKLQQEASIKTDEANINALRANLQFANRVGQSDLEIRRQLDLLLRQVAPKEDVLEEQTEQLKEAEKRLSEYEDIELPDVQTVLEPIRADIVVQQSLLNEIDVELQNLTIDAPIDGIISAIWHRPGERIVAGEPIVTIARRGSTTVVSYFREKTGVEPYEGMEVGLRYPEPGSREYPSTIEHVGPHVEQVPPHQLKDQTTLEWATPVRITIPDDMLRDGVRPGQLLNVIVKEPRRGRRADNGGP